MLEEDSLSEDGDVMEKLNLCKDEPDPEFENFIARVDEISKVIHKLSATSNDEDAEKAMMQADLILRDEKNKGDFDESDVKVKSSRTVINKADVEEVGQGEIGVTSFKRMVEKDAKERFEDKERRKKAAAELRRKGNICYHKEDFGGALCNYNKAIQLIKDSACLYNNRALCLIKLSLYSDAMEDCKKALEINQFSIKARLNMSKAYFLSGQPEKCKECLNEATHKMPGHTKMIEDFASGLFNMGLPKFEFDLPTEKIWQEASEGTIKEAFD